MSSLIGSTLFKLGLPVMAVLIVLLAARARGISWGEDLGFLRPKPRRVFIWLGLWLAWILASEVLIRAFGLAQARAWPHYPPIIVALRILAIGIAGPLAEELVMRGMVWHRLQRTAVGPLRAVVIVAVLWAAMHYRYGLGTVILIVGDGVILGLARYRGGSLWLPIAMHMMGNLISIGQSLAAS